MAVRTELASHEWSEDLMPPEVASQIPGITKGLGRSPEDVVYARLSIPDYNFDWYILGRDAQSGRIYAFVQTRRRNPDDENTFVLDMHPDDVWLDDIENSNKVWNQRGFGRESGEDMKLILRQVDWEPTELGSIKAYRDKKMTPEQREAYDRDLQERRAEAARKTMTLPRIEDVPEIDGTSESSASDALDQGDDESGKATIMVFQYNGADHGFTPTPIDENGDPLDPNLDLDGYKLVYKGPYDPEQGLERFFYDLNRKKDDSFAGTLAPSISDLFVIHEGDSHTAHYFDFMGTTDVTSTYDKAVKNGIIDTVIEQKPKISGDSAHVEDGELGISPEAHSETSSKEVSPSDFNDLDEPPDEVLGYSDEAPYTRTVTAEDVPVVEEAEAVPVQDVADTLPETEDRDASQAADAVEDSSEEQIGENHDLNVGDRASDTYEDGLYDNSTDAVQDMMADEQLDNDLKAEAEQIASLDDETDEAENDESYGMDTDNHDDAVDADGIEDQGAAVVDDEIVDQDYYPADDELVDDIADDEVEDGYSAMQEHQDETVEDQREASSVVVERKRNLSPAVLAKRAKLAARGQSKRVQIPTPAHMAR